MNKLRISKRHYLLAIGEDGVPLQLYNRWHNAGSSRHN